MQAAIPVLASFRGKEAKVWEFLSMVRTGMLEIDLWLNKSHLNNRLGSTHVGQTTAKWNSNLFA